MKDMRRIAYSYVRFSTPDQAKGDSLRRQREASKALAQENGWVLDQTLNLFDAGVSSYKGLNAKEGSLAVFLQLIKDKQIPKGSVLIVESLDRLSREEIDDAFDRFRSIIKSGVDIATTNPKRVYGTASLKSIAELIEPLIIMSRANEESNTKSQRVAAAWAKKRTVASQRILTKQCPTWLFVVDGKFCKEPTCVRTIEQIFAWAIEGFGVALITQMLQANFKTITKGNNKRRGNRWHKSFVLKLLHNRALLGEFQPCSKDRKPVGEPIPNYFPRVIDEATFYKAQQALKNRTAQRGAVGDKCVNLFTGLIYNARDGERMVLKKRATSTDLVTMKSEITGGAARIPFPYHEAEQALLGYLGKLNLSMLTNGKNKGRASELRDLIDASEGKLAAIENKLTKIKKKMTDDDSDVETIVDLLRSLDKQRKTLREEIERYKEQQHQLGDDNGKNALQEIHSLIATLEGEELKELRLRLRSVIKQAIDKIWMVIYHQNNRRHAHIQVNFVALPFLSSRLGKREAFSDFQRCLRR